MEGKPTGISTKCNPIPGRCSFFVERKHRFCKLEAAAGRKHCAQHLTAEKGDDSISKDGATLRERIPCPLDAKHSCYADRLKQHLKKCNAREKDLPVYHVKGINRIGADDEDNVQMTLSSLTKEELLKLIDCVKTLCKAHPVDISSAILSHPVLADELSKPSNGPSAKKHLHQMASLLGQLQDVKLLGADTCYVEFGAGRGHLSHWVQQAVIDQPKVSFLLIDRAHVRHKMDTLHRFQKDGPQYERLRIDIEHLHLGNVSSVSDVDTPIAAYSKHLCGAATDLTLHCLMETLISKHDNNTNDPSSTKPSCSQVNGIVIALCCHHRCNWSTFVGREWWLAQGLTAQDFLAVSHMTSWATCGPATGLHKKKINSKNLNVKEPGEDHLNKHEYKAEMASEIDRLQRDATEKEKDVTNMLWTPEELAGKSGDVDKQSSGQGSRKIEHEYDSGHKSKVSKLETDTDVHSGGGDVSAQRLVGLDVSEREEIGRQCKRLIDIGRIAYLKSHGFKSHLVYYVDKELSLENVAMIALPDTQL